MGYLMGRDMETTLATSKGERRLAITLATATWMGTAYLGLPLAIVTHEKLMREYMHVALWLSVLVLTPITGLVLVLRKRMSANLQAVALRTGIGLGAVVAFLVFELYSTSMITPPW